MNAEAGELPLQDVASGRRLVANSKAARIAELANERAEGPRAFGDGAEGTTVCAPLRNSSNVTYDLVKASRSFHGD